jgi:uncharacterized membrane protein YfcA
MDERILIFIAVGFLAQIIDGALGMAYGVTSTSFLLSIGISPVAASASVHIAEVFTTAVSGLSHLKLGNIDRALFRRLLLPGVIGGVIGAYILTELPGKAIKPFIAAYLLTMGLRILWKAARKTPTLVVRTRHTILALAGGFCDAVGGGGWGPIVTSTLVANGNEPRYSIGTVNLTEFFVTLAEAIAFIALLRLVHWQVILGLLIGGVIAAPFAAVLCKRLPARALMWVVGSLITILSLRTIVMALA